LLESGVADKEMVHAVPAARERFGDVAHPGTESTDE